MTIIQEKKENIIFADNLFKDALVFFESDAYKESLEKVYECYKIYVESNISEKTSICLTLIVILKIFLKEGTYKSNLHLLEDAKFLAKESNRGNALGVNKWAFGEIAILDGNYEESLLYLEGAAEQVKDYPYILIKIYESLAYSNLILKNYENSERYIMKANEAAQKYQYKETNKRVKQIEKSLSEFAKYGKDKDLSHFEGTENIDRDPLIALLKIARTISAEINIDKLLKTIAEQARYALNADRCTVFLIDKEKKELWSKIALGLEETEIRFPIDRGLAGSVVLSGETVNIKNAYKDKRFNPDIDLQTGYRTSTILCMPIRNLKYEIIGVFQVINKFNGSFTKPDEDLLITIGAIAGIAIENNKLFETQQRMLLEQKSLFKGFIDTLAASIDARDKITAGHSLRVTKYSDIICERLGIDKEEREIICQAAILHDIGKIGIRDSVLQKKGKLTKEEYQHIQDHVRITYDILSKIADKSKSFKDVVEIASSHHEKFNGEGYFRKMRGEQIPIGGRILAVADVFDAVTSIRHYRDRMPIQDAVNIIKEGADTHFDRRISDLFLSVSCDKIIDIILSQSDVKFDNNSKEVLKNYTLTDIATLIKKDAKTQREKQVIDIFNNLYLNKASKEQN